MSVQVNLTFNSVDEAIVALGRMVVAKVAAPVAPVEKAPRAGRSDAGKPRGPHKTTGEPAASEPGKGGGVSAPVSQPAAPATPTTAAAPVKEATPPTLPTGTPANVAGIAPAAAAPKAPAPSPDQVQAAVEKLFNAKGFEDCAGVLSRFGVKRGKDLAEDQRADFIAKTERVIAGEAI